jgi:hypothetical protein
VPVVAGRRETSSKVSMPIGVKLDDIEFYSNWH